jgi:hypothetical protein
VSAAPLAPRRPVPVVVLLLCGGIGILCDTPLLAEAPPPVEFEIVAPERAVLRETTRIELRIANRGTTPIRDVGLKLSRGYANVMTVIDTQPRATIDDASTEKRIYFGTLGPGEAMVYRVLVVPQRTGEHTLVARVVAARRGFEPIVLTDRATGRAEVTAKTLVEPGR